MKNDESKGDIPMEMFERKYKKLSIHSEGFTNLLVEIFPKLGVHMAQRKVDIKKPEPVLREQWLQTKVDLYRVTDRITNGVLGPPNPPGPPGGGKPPFGFSDDDFRGPWLFIDPRQIELISDTQDGRGRAALFPIVLSPNDPTKRKTIWVKAALLKGVEEREPVVDLLKKALQEVQSEKEAPKKAEDSSGRVQVSTDTFAAMVHPGPPSAMLS